MLFFIHFLRHLWLWSLLLAMYQSAGLAEAEEDWTLVWQDEFEEDEIDFTKWAVEENGHGGGNEELQYYLDRSKNIRTENGHLVIEAHRERINVAGVVKEYSSGRIRTKRRHAWTYGRFEVRAKLPRGQGLWPAVWMLPEDNRYGGWAASGEIDIVEAKGNDSRTIHGSLHFGGEWPENEHNTKAYRLETDTSKAFHTFALEWSPEEIRWYVDGVVYHRFRGWHSSAAGYPAPFDQPFHLILNLAVGGRFGGNPDSRTPFPARMIVDWVRVYQQNQDPDVKEVEKISR